MAKRFKHNADISFVHYMADDYSLSRSVWHGDISKEEEIDLEAVLESLE